MEQYLSFRNFRQFERSRREIRLPYDLLNDLRFRQLPDAQKAHLICLLLLSARMDNVLPNNPLRLEQLIGASAFGAGSVCRRGISLEVRLTKAIPGGRRG